MKPLKMLVGALALLSLSAQAKTVALWPLETNDLRCVVNPLNDLSKIASHFVNDGAEAQWELPPIPMPTAIHSCRSTVPPCASRLSALKMVFCTTFTPGVTSGGTGRLPSRDT